MINDIDITERMFLPQLQKICDDKNAILKKWAYMPVLWNLDDSQIMANAKTIVFIRGAILN